MKINNNQKHKIISIWNQYSNDNSIVYDTKGKELPEIDKQRLEAIPTLQILIQQFLNKELDVKDFKTNIDSFNKRNNLWGFTAIKGQMFFNQLVRTAGGDHEQIATLLRSTISQPNNLEEASFKIEKLENYCLTLRDESTDKRKVPKASSAAYFLSYFWQITNRDKWPIFYTSQVRSYDAIGIWEGTNIQKEDYKYFFNLNEEIKEILSTHAQQQLSNWDIEHAFWNYNGNPNSKAETTQSSSVKSKVEEIETTEVETTPLISSFSLSEYLIPKVANLIELGANTEKSASAKGSAFEKLVAEIFNLLDFEVDTLGQGTGRNPDAIIKFREENTAFIVDAKAYANGYSLGIDDRAIKEYINHYTPILQKDGYKKIGFIIVSNSFKSNYESFVNEITWNTDVKRFILLSSEALLYLLAFKTKDRRLNLSDIIDCLISMPNPVIASKVITDFADI